MNTTTYVVGTAALTVAGRWAQEKPIDIRIALGAGVFAIGISLVDNQSPEIAQKLCLAVLITVAFMYVPDIAKKTGITEARKPEKK